MKADEETAQDLDINAFLDRELDEQGTREVQLRLSRDPTAAAQVMADMAIAQALRAAGGLELAKPSPATLRLARRLENALASPWRRRYAVQAAVVLLSLGCGWFLGSAKSHLEGLARAPAFVDEAVMSHRTALLRARMDSQPEVTTYDAKEISTATKISLPRIPYTWRVTDAQVYPSAEGPSVGLSFLTPQGPVSLFAFHTSAADKIAPTIVQRGSSYVSYWQTDDLAFVLIGGSNPKGLQTIAVDLAEPRRVRPS
jgi:anti-sigma factor RsiW